MKSMPRLVVALVATLVVPALAFAAAGGPDNFGYIWLDQNEPGITSSIPAPTGPPVAIGLGSESVSAPIPLGFSFPFYGNTYTSAVISDNGWLSFDTSFTAPSPLPGPIPGFAQPNLAISWYWRDLSAPSIMDYYNFAGGGFFLIRSTLPSDPANFIQLYVVLYSTGIIKLYYVLENDPITASIGIENGAGDDGLSPWSAGTGGVNGFLLTGGSIAQFFPPASLDCSAPTPIACGQTLRGTSPASVPANVSGYLCSPNSYLGREKVYELDVTRLSDVNISLANMTGGIDLDVMLIRGTSCNEFQCMAGGADTIVRPLLPTGRYYIVVDGKAATDNGSFDLSVSCTPRTNFATCGTTGITGTTSGASQWAVYPSCSNQTFDGPEQIYEIPFMPPGNLKLTLTPLGGAELDLVAFGPDTFAPPNGCISWGDNNLTLFDPPPGTYYVMVEGRTLGGTVPGAGSYSLDISCDVLLTCASPAGDLQCEVPITGTTVGATNRAEQYSCSQTLHTGGEVVYSFTNPIRRTVSFLYNGPPDLKLLLVRSTCNEGSCVVYGDGRLVARDLDPGDYYLVVDGVNGASGAFTITPICGNKVDPPTGNWTLSTCESVHETKVATVNADITRGDVVFAFDDTGSMGGPLNNLKTTSRTIINELDAVIDDVQFGLASFEDYNGSYTSCGYSGGYGGGTDRPYRLNQPITGNLTQLFAAIDGVTLGGGGDLPESYTATYWEMYNDAANIGWRPGARRITVMIGDDEPHSCDTDYCGTPRASTGVEPGPNGTTGDADDLEIGPVMDLLRTEGITPIYLFTGNGGKPGLLAPWQCWTRRGGGDAYSAPGGSAPPTLVNDIRTLIESKSLNCATLEVRASTGFAAWISNVTPGPLPVSLPARQIFDFDLAPPPGTPGGVYNFTVDFICDGIIKASQLVTVTVPPLCLAAASAVTPGCSGADVTLDGSTSTSCCTGALEYRWLDGVTPVCGWSTTPTCVVAPTAATTYTLEIRCAAGAGVECGTLTTTSTVDVVPAPIPDLLPITSVCAGGDVTLDARGSAANGCPVALEYQFRDGATILQAWSGTATYGPFPGATSATYSVDVRCPVSTTGCESTTSELLTVVPFPTADLRPLPAICAGASAILDGSGSTGNGCSVPLEYQFRAGATILQPWSPTSTYGPVSPAATTTYVIDVRCPAGPGCEASSMQTQTVVPNPVAAAGTDATTCRAMMVTLDGAGSTDLGCPGGLEYEWRLGATVVRPWAPTPSWNPPTMTAGTFVYTLAVRCAQPPSCEVTDDVRLVVDLCLAVHFDAVAAEFQAGDTVAVTWTTSLEDGTILFAVERASSLDGVFEMLGTLPAHGTGLAYRFVDETAPQGTTPWYRIVEHTANGRGDVSPAVQPRATTGQPKAGGGRGRGSARSRGIR